MSESQQIFKLSTGVIFAAGYANKLRRVALAVLGNNVPRDIIINEISKLNQELYKEIVEKMKIEKRDPIQITLNAIYDKQMNKLEFKDIIIEKFVPESKIASSLENANKEINSLKEEISNLKNKYEKEIEAYKKQSEKVKEFLNNLLNEVKNLLETI